MRKTGTATRMERLAFIPLGFAALISLFTGIRHALQYGCHDLQWAGARLVGQHIDPWHEELARLPHSLPHFSPPNYLHLLYLLLLPLGLLDFRAAAIFWTVGTICLSGICILLLRRLFDLTGYQTGLALCLLWMSSPFRVVLEVGQMSFYELFFLSCAYLLASTALGGLSLGFSFAKYSFSPAAVMLFLFRGRIRLLLYSAVVPIVGLLGVSLLVKTPLPTLTVEPFAVSASPTAVSPGFADVMTLVEHTLKSFLPLAHARQLAYGLGLLGSAAYALLLSRFRLGRAAEFTLISVASLFFVKHLIYDYIFLVVLLCFALTQQSVRIKGLLVTGVLVFWFLLPLFERKAQNEYPVQLAINCFLLALLLIFTTRVVITDANQGQGFPSR